MQTRPDKTELLKAVARFLEKEVRPAIKDPSLSFRVLIAANLASVVAAEMSVEDMAVHAELERLEALMPDLKIDIQKALSSQEGRKDALERYNRELCTRIKTLHFKDAETSEAVWDHVMTTLRGELLTSSAGFDTSLDIE